MSIRSITDDKLLTETEMLNRIENALVNKRPFSLVRLGDLENLVLGQFKFLAEIKYLTSLYIENVIKENSFIRGKNSSNTVVKVLSSQISNYGIK